MLDAASDEIRRDYQALLKEIELFDHHLSKRPKVMVVNKIDLLPRMKKIKIGKKDEEVCYISALTGKGLKELLGIIRSELEKIREKDIESLQDDGF
jgi:50S ribosomal subunit-associated GTPase HflX